MNAMVRGCLLRGCVFPAAFVVCLSVLALQRFLRGSVGEVSGCVGINRSLHNGEGKCAEGWGPEPPDPAPARCRGVELDDL